jgi:hypothetical protein
MINNLAANVKKDIDYGLRPEKYLFKNRDNSYLWNTRGEVVRYLIGKIETKRFFYLIWRKN